MTRSAYRLLPFLALASLGTPALAQSADSDADLFGENEKYLRIGDDEENITFAPFVQLDAGYSDLNPGGDDFDTNVRLARLYVFAKKGDFNGTFAYDFNSNVLRYAFGAYQPTDNLKIQVGQQDEPFSLQDYSGSRFLPFAEAGRSAALIPGDNVGALLRYSGSNYSLAGGVFGGNLNAGVNENGIAATGRVTWAPIYEQSEITRGGDATSSGVGTQRVENLLHLGLAASARFDIDDPVSLSSNANSSLITTTIGSSPAIRNVDRLLLFNIEAARSIGSLSFQSEFTAADVDAPLVNGTSHGGYLYATYFVTGEKRGYSRGSGTFGRVIPKNPVGGGGIGAIEVGARIDYLDSTDLGSDYGAEWGLTGVANVYLTKRFTLSADYSYSKATAGQNDGLEGHAVTARFQFAY